MRHIIILILCYSACLVQGQERDHRYEQLCSRATLDLPNIPLPQPNENVPESEATCFHSNARAFSTLTAEELYDYITTVDDPYTCVNRILYGYNSQYSPIIFSDDKVRYIADQTWQLATDFDGAQDNGVYGSFTYLSIAGLMATFYSSSISLSPDTWESMRYACRALATNQNATGETALSYYTFGHMFFAASFDEIGADSAIVSVAKKFLDDIANDSYTATSLTDLYPYYYCYYYLLDLYFRYPTDDAVFIDEIVLQDEVVTSLGDVATNLNLNTDTYVHFADLSVQSVSSLGRFAPHPVLQHVTEPALTAVTETYPSTDARWVHAALAIVQNGMTFPLTEEEILTDLEESLLPNNFIFEDGQVAIATPLPYEDILPLYQSILEVRAQFFRMMESDEAILNDVNDTLFVKLYGEREDYRNFNNLLFGVNYPNSGGVYIELYSTFYTYQREPDESTYTMEELFRHEYTHYLQGRYVVPGGWGQSPMYNDSRLVWFEEGMAQFFAASTRTSDVQALSLIRDNIQNGQLQDLESVFSSGYATGNPDAYYIYGAMLWTKFFHDDRTLFLQFLDLIRNGDLDTFDALVTSMRESEQANDDFITFIDSLILENDIWITPQSNSILLYELDPHCLDTIVSEVLDIIPDLDIDTAMISISELPRQFEISGQVSIDYEGSDPGVINRLITQKLNGYLTSLEGSSYNNFDYTTAFYDQLTGDEESGPYTADFHISGPINDLCRPLDVTDMLAEPYADSVLLFAPADLPLAHQFKYREIGTTTWIEMDTSSLVPDQIDDLTSIYGYEYQLSYLCALDSWSPYSGSKTFYLCPDEVVYSQSISEDLTITSSQHLSSKSMIDSDASVTFSASQSISLLPDFQIDTGSRLVVSHDDCRVRN